MAFMKSTGTGKYFLTEGGLFAREDIGQTAAGQVKEVLGFGSAAASGEAIKAELKRVAINRAQLVKDITDAVLAGVAAGITVTADIDEAAIARAVELQLADEFKSMPDKVADELHDRTAS